jgi:hypothetical protein
LADDGNESGWRLKTTDTSWTRGKSPELIALAAQHFVQEDDITVLTVTRLRATQEASIELTSPELSPSLA